MSVCMCALCVFYKRVERGVGFVAFLLLELAIVSWSKQEDMDIHIRNHSHEVFTSFTSFTIITFQCSSKAKHPFCRQTGCDLRSSPCRGPTGLEPQPGPLHPPVAPVSNLRSRAREHGVSVGGALASAAALSGAGGEGYGTLRAAEEAGAAVVEVLAVTILVRELPVI